MPEARARRGWWWWSGLLKRRGEGVSEREIGQRGELDFFDSILIYVLEGSMGQDRIG